MNRDDVQIGSTITNGASALRITERVAKDPRWKTSGWRGIVVPLEEFGNRGVTSFVPDYLLGSWHHLPFEWRAILGGGLEERYVWAPGWRWLNREVRPSQTLPEKAPEPPVKHGVAGYEYWGCRCSTCQNAHKEKGRTLRSGARERAKENPEIVPHGTSSGYTYWGCRCDKCKGAKSRGGRGVTA